MMINPLCNPTQIAIWILTLILFTSCTKEEEKQKKELIRPVKYQKVHHLGIDKTRSFSGVSSAGVETNLSFRIGGILQSVHVKVGGRVKKGKLIAAMDDSDDVLKYEEAKAAFNSAQIQKQHADSNLDRIKKLYEDNNVSLSEYENAKNRHAAAKADYNSKLKRLDLQKRRLGYSKLYAPMAGIIARVSVERNENVQPGQVIVVLNSGDDIEVNVGIPESYIHYIKTGENVEVSFSSIPEETFEGTISQVSYVSSGASTYPVTIKLKSATDRLRPGMPAKVRFKFPTGEDKQFIIIPTNAVSEDTKGKFVFVVEGQGEGLAVVHKKIVEIGKLTNEGFEVIQGLEDGERVVTSGVSKITEGMTVRFIK